jgi:hypothetical protein
MEPMRMRRYGFTFLFIFFLPLAGCALFLPQRIPQHFERPKQCQEFLNQLDEKVEEAGVREASSFSIPGFPYLRIDRFLSALKRSLNGDREREAWVRWMQQLDLAARRREVSNLPDEIVLSMVSKEPQKVDRGRLISQVESCSFELLNHDQQRSDFYETLYPLVNVPDEYSCLMRTIGLYPLIALPVAVITESSRNKIRSWFNENLEDLPIDGHLTAFVPTESISLDEKEIEEMVEKSRKNPLRVPLLDEKQAKKLIRSFAPVFIQDVAAFYDRMGRVVWRGDRVEIDPERPTLYYYISYAFLKGEPILQLNYVIWYSGRAGKRAPWIERGHLDGLTARVSLDAKGKPFMVDVMMDCGCYHLFAPRKERVDQVHSRPFMFDPFVPQWLPALPLGKPLGIRISSGWHQVQRLMAVGESPGPIPYELVPYNILEALPHEEGRTESIFDAKGVVKGSERMERFILFSMGIPSVGSMRQKGHHAIELIGRVHFDDPDLFDQNFIFK